MEMDKFLWTIFMILLRCLVYLHLILLMCLWFERRRWDALAKIPGPSTFPIFSDMRHLLMICSASSYCKLLHLRQKYGPIFRFWLGRNSFVTITNPDIIKMIYSHKHIINRPDIITGLTKPIFLEGVLLAKNENALKGRKALSFILNRNYINTFVQNYAKNSNILVSKLLDDAKGTAINIHHYFTQCALDILCETIMGVPVHAQNNNCLISLCVAKCINIVAQRTMRPWLLTDSIFKMIRLGKEYHNNLESHHGKIREIISERQRTIQRKVNLDQQATFIDLLLMKDGKTEEEVLAECTNLVEAGVHTIASTCCYALVLLAENPDIQNKLLQEQIKIFGKESLKRSVTAEDLPQMQYLEQVIKETLRLYPTIPFVFRQHDQDLHIGSGMTIPANTNIVIWHYMLQRDSTYFSDPLKFNPDRFSPSADKKLHPYAYIPFGGGRRLCIGYKMAMAEIKAVLSTVLRNIHIKEAVNSMAEMEKTFFVSIDLRSCLEILVKLLPRNQSAESTIL